MLVHGKHIFTRHLIPSDEAAALARPWIVFLHEGLGCVTAWKSFPRELCELLGCRGFVYDRLGYGRSDPFDGPRRVDYLVHEAARWLPGVLDAAGIERPVLFGHSDGATIALAFAAMYPDRVTAVVSEAAHVFVEPLTLGSIRAAADAYERGALKAKLDPHHHGKTDAMFHGWADTWLAPENGAWDMRDMLPSITCPVLVLQGADDVYGTEAQVRAIVEGVAGPVRGEILPACGHIAHHQARAAVVRIVGEWADRELRITDDELRIV